MLFRRHNNRQTIISAGMISNSEFMIPWPALLAYERGEDFDLASLPAPVLLPPAELLPAPLPKLDTPAAPPGVLRVA